LEAVERATRASCDEDLFLYHLGQCRGRDQLTNKLEQAEARTRDSVERRASIEAHLLLPEVREACEDFVRGHPHVSLHVAGVFLHGRTSSVADVLALDANARRVTERKVALAEALQSVQCPQRSDSRLCSDYLRGCTRLTAEQVAHKVAHARWLHEYMHGAYKKAVDGEARSLAADRDDSDDEGGYYSGIYTDATRIVQRRREFAPPERWPWM
jgi:hypothetical protein